MTPNFLKKILTAHYIWLESNGKSGQKADLWNADLRNIDLKGVNLRDAYLRYASLYKANLAGADLSGVNLTSADLRNSNLSGADLSNADLYETDLSFANLSFANLTNTNLSHTHLKGVNLSHTDLSKTNITGAKLYIANFTGAKGLLNPTKWMDSNFQKNNKGYIVFKKLGKGKTEFPPPDYWIIEEDSYLTEIVNEDRGEDCSYGINFGTKNWCEYHYPNADLWKCLLEFDDLEKLVVPYATDGKARCGRLKLLRKEK